MTCSCSSQINDMFTLEIIILPQILYFCFSQCWIHLLRENLHFPNGDAPFLSFLLRIISALINPLTKNVSHHIETSQLICRAN